jgi:hypothetical protein
MRTRQCTKIGIGRCINVDFVRIDVRKQSLAIWESDKPWSDVDEFAKLDGFKDRRDMHAFWLEEHGMGSFFGVMIRWEPMS